MQRSGRLGQPPSRASSSRARTQQSRNGETSHDIRPIHMPGQLMVSSSSPLCTANGARAIALYAGQNNTTKHDSAPSPMPPAASSIPPHHAPENVLQLVAPAGGRPIPTLEGPLPAEMREMIHSSCTGETAELAERHARRLLSTSRRVRVYREELQSAMEEVGDVTQLVQRHHTVQEALRAEMSELDIRIDQLTRERRLCELQLRQEDDSLQRRQEKLQEANERVNVLRSTIDAITKESLAGYLMLRQLVPNLHVDNYVS